MQLFPAIDLRGGKVVRLTQGDYDRMTVYGDDPCAQARQFVEAGARYLHVVDLDAQRTAPFPTTDPLPRWQSRGACISRWAAASARRSALKNTFLWA